MSHQNSSVVPPHVTLAAMSRWYVVSRAIHAVARLKIANFMADTPMHIMQLAQLTQTQPDYLARILRYLAAYNIFQEVTPEYFINTTLSQPLRDDNPNTIRDMLCMVDADWWGAFGELEQCLVAGGAGHVKAHGRGFFENLMANPAQQLLYDTGMDRISALDNKEIVAAYDFSDIHHLVDLGGGKGGILLELMRQYPTLKTTLFDSAAVLAHRHPALEQQFPARCKYVAGDFFIAIPPQADAYLFKGVLHDFSHANAIKILQLCRQQMAQNAVVLIAEQVIPDTTGPHVNKTMDIVMMALLDGRQRTMPEWQSLASTCGFKVSRICNTASIFTLFELTPD